MVTDKAPLIAALEPLVRRVRTDVTAIKKAGGGQLWTSEPLTEERLARHLNGGPARGVSPIKPGESVTLVALLDFDSHRGEVPWGEMAATAARVMAALDLAWGANPLAFRSSGGAGIHLIMVWDEPQDARAVRQWLAGVLAGCDLRPGTGGVRAGEVEVFPRQDRVRAGGYGNQFILPLAGRSEWLEYDDLADTLGPASGPLQAGAWRGSAPVPAAGPAQQEQRESAGGAGVGDGGGGVPPADWGDRVWAPLEAIPNGRGARGELGAAEGLDYDSWLRVCYAVHWATGGDPGAMARLEEWCARSAKYVPGYLEAKVWGPASAAGRRAGAGDRVTTVETLWVEARRHGWVDAREVDAFPVLERVSSKPAPSDTSPPPPERRGVPLAKHLTTDQANANRLVKSFGDRVLVAAGRWHTWDGSRWLADEADLYRYACRLSEIVKAEAAAWRRKSREGAS